MSDPILIDRFVAALRTRLNRFRFLDLLLRTLTILAAILLVVSLTYVLRGYAVPRGIYLPLLPAVPILAALSWFVSRRSDDQAARFADDFFGLKDSVSSYWHFRREHRSGAVYELQGAGTAAKLEALSPDAVTYRWPKRLILTAIGLVALSSVLAFKTASPEILARLQVEAETTEKTAEINEFLEEMIEELRDEETVTELDPNELREIVAQLKTTGDRNEALRQYAELERKMQEAARKLDQRRNETLLARVGEELQKAPEEDPRALGKKLAEKKFREAGADLARMAPETVDPKTLDESRKELAKLKSAASRMSAAAKAAGRSASSGKGSESEAEAGAGAQGSSGKSSSGGSANGKGGKGGKGASGDGELDDLLSQLHDSVANLDQSLEDAALEKSQSGECSSKTLGQCKSNRDAVLSHLQKLNQSLCKVASKCEARSKLLSMCQKMGQCQGYLGEAKFASLGQCMSQGTGAGIGQGSVESRREGSDPLTMNGESSQLQGIKGQGPSDSTTESADDGSGVSTLRGQAREREFRHQIESFVMREDVPDDVKDGVKVYFEKIHRTEAP